MQPSEPGTVNIEPRVTVFLCDKCCGNPPPWTHESHPAQVADLRFKCAAEVGPDDIGAALADGADGVLVLGCLMADCLTERDQVRTLRSIYDSQLRLKNMGLGLQRLRLEWVAPCEIERLDAVLGGFCADLQRYLQTQALPLHERRGEA